MAIVPLNLDFSTIDYRSELVETTKDGLKSFCWDLLNIEISFVDSEENRYWPRIEDIEKQTPSFKFHEKFGYTIDKFSEFLIIAEEWDYAPNVCIKVDGGIEISVGDLTPMGCYIFDIFHDNNYHPEFEYCKSIRIHGCSSDGVELYLLNALNKLKDELKFSFSFVSLTTPDYEEEENEKEYEIKEDKSLIPNFDIIPNRLLYKGIEETDKSNSFLDFYRILEYYSIIIMENEINILRNNPSISKRDFVIDLNKRMNDNERALLGRLVKQVADGKLLNFCEKNNIIDKPKPDLLSNNLYDFRNSLVHAKSNQKLLTYTKSIFIRDKNLDNWTYICKELAKNAMRKF